MLKYNTIITFIIVLTTILPTFLSCTDIFDNVVKYADNEIIYTDKLDGIINVKIGYERVEVDLMEAGRIPASRIKMGKATRTIIECEDFEEENHRRVIDSICSWVNITGLTKLKNYKFKIYTGDEYGNLSLPLEVEARPYTQENLDALQLTPPVIIESSNAALIEWKDPLSSVIYNVINYSYQYADITETTREGEGDGDLPVIFVENISKENKTSIELSFKIIPTITNSDGTYSSILDTVIWHSSILLEISSDAIPAVFLKDPKPALTIDINDFDDLFPLVFTWTKIQESEDYILKISEEPDFPNIASKTVEYMINAANEYLMDEEEGEIVVNKFLKGRSKELYWTVVPLSSNINVTTQTRKLYFTKSPIMLGNWIFEDATNITRASVGNDLVMIGNGFLSVPGVNNDKAVKVSQGSYFKCTYDLYDDTDEYTIMYYMKFTDTGYHTLLQTDINNSDRAEFGFNTLGNPEINGVGAASAFPYAIGPNHWHEVFITASKGYLKFYIDGELAYTGLSKNIRYNLNKEGTLFFADSSGNDNEIEVSEIALWDVALEPEEMLEFRNLKRINKMELSVADFSSAELAGYPATQIIDGNLTNYPWTTAIEPPNWVIVDLGRNRNIGRVVVFTSTWEAANPKIIQLFTGDNLSNHTSWSKVGELVRGGASRNPWGCMLMYDFKASKINNRYLKIYIPERYGIQSPIGQVIVYEKQ
ncbi:MAG: hypothetical protein M0Q54_03325 [Pigmentiphaga sp.]|nr:hypothetical protein [Pigmentiphaga sp.]